MPTDTSDVIRHPRWLVALVMVLLVANVAAAGAWLATRLFQGELGQHEERIEGLLGRATGLVWQLDGLQLQWRGLNPIVEMRSLRASPANETALAQAISAAGGQDVVHASNLHVYVDTLRSLLSMQPRLFGLRAERGEVVLRKQQGRIAVAGMQLGRGNFKGGEFLARLRYADLPDLRFAVMENNGSEEVVRALPALELALRSGSDSRLLLQSQSGSWPAGQVDGVRLRATADGKWDYAGANVQGGLELGGKSGAQWASLFLPGAQSPALQIEAWARRPAFGETVASATLFGAALEIPPRIAGLLPGEPLVLPAVESLAGKIALSWRAAGDFLLFWRESTANVDGEPIGLPDGRFMADQDWLGRSRKTLALSSVDIALARAEVARLRLLPENRLQLLDNIDPRGTLRDLTLTIGDTGRKTFDLQAQLDGLDAKPWRGVPGVSNLRGALQFNAAQGSFRFAPNTDFSVRFPTLYRESLSFASAQGEVGWRLAGPRLMIDSGELALKPLAHDALLGAQFSVNAKIAPDETPSQLRLRIGYTDAELPNLLQYIPYTLSQGFLKWIVDADARGKSQRGGFIFNGSLEKGDRDNREVRVFLDLNGASATYASGWPRAEDLQGLVMIEPARTAVRLQSARVAAVPLRGLQATIHSVAGVPQLDLATGVGGSLGSALALLKGAPIGEGMLPVIKDWRAAGQLDRAQLSFSLPLNGQSLQPGEVSFSSELAAASLHMPRLDLTLENLAGKVFYDLERGLHSQRLTAQLFGEPWQFRLGPAQERRGRAGQELHLSASGRASTAALQNWLRLPLLGFANGRAQFDVALEQSPARSELQVSSKLQGVSLEAPLPFYKQPQRVQPLALKWNLRDPRQPLSLALPGLMHGLFEFDEFNFNKGLVSLGNQSRPVSAAQVASTDARRLALAGQLEHFSFAAWRDAFSRYQAYEKATPGAGIVQAKPLRLNGRGIAIGSADLLGQQLDDAIVDFSQRDNELWIKLDSDRVRGQILWPTSNAASGSQGAKAASPPVRRPLAKMPSLPALPPMEARMRLDLDYLHLRNLPAAGSQSGGASGQSMFNPKNLWPLAVNVRDLSLGGKKWGAWKFLLSASNSAALVHAIDGEISGLRVSSESDDGLLWAYNDVGELNTSLHADLRSDSFDKFLQESVADPGKIPLRAQEFSMGLALAWPGAPLDAKLIALNGDIDVAVGAGKFYRVSESATGLLKLLGLFNFDSLLRRMQLDFSDVYKEGLSFDSIRGELLFEDQSVSFLRTPIEVRSPSSKFSLAGSVDLAASTIDAELVATMPVANNLPWIAALAGGLPVAAGAFIVTRVLGEQFDQLSSAVYSVRGPMDAPEVKFDRMFDNRKPVSANGKPAAK